MSSSEGMRDETLAPAIEGRTLDGRYHIDALLGTGGMGAVFSGTQITLEKPVAIKVLKPEYARRPTAVKRFLREARAASKINHRNVVEVIDFGQDDDGLVYFVMEFLDGTDLSELLNRDAPIGWPRARRLLLQIVRALKAAHGKGIIHRDIKPANCFLVDTPDDEPDFIKVLDFGIAKVIEAEEQASTGLTSTSQVMGTALYMAPEQALGRTIDAKTDVYALGVLAFEMLTGHKPFLGATAFEVLMKRVAEPPPMARQVAPHLTAAVEDMLQRAMARDPVARYQTMREFEEALTSIADDLGQTNDPGPPQPAATVDQVSDLDLLETATSSRHRLPSGQDTQVVDEVGDPGPPLPSEQATEAAPVLSVIAEPNPDPGSTVRAPSDRSAAPTVEIGVRDEVPPPSRKWGVAAVVGVLAVGGVGAAFLRPWEGGEPQQQSVATVAEEKGDAAPVAVARPESSPAQPLPVPSAEATPPPTEPEPEPEPEPETPTAESAPEKPDAEPPKTDPAVKKPKSSRPRPKKPVTDASKLASARKKAKRSCTKQGAGSVKIDFWVEASGKIGMFSDRGSAAPKPARGCVERILRGTTFPAGAPRMLKFRTDL